MRKRISTIVVGLIFGLTACQSDRLSNESTVGPEVTRMADLTAPPTFDWSTHRSHKLILALGDQAPAPGKYLVKIYTGSVDDPAGARFSGFIDAQNPLVTDIQLPSSTEKIFARVFSPNGSSTTTELPNYETISHTFFRSQKTAKAATTIACSGCSGTYNGSGATYSGNSTKCITSFTGSGGTINVQNSKILRICANGTIGTINLSSNAALEIADGVSVTIGTLNVNSGTTVTVGDGATVTVNQNCSPNGTITNRGTMDFKKVFGPNSGSTIHNYCKIIAKNNSTLNSNKFYNHSFCQWQNKLTINSGAKLYVDPNSHTKMEDLQLNGEIKHNGGSGTALLEVTDLAKANYGAKVDGNIKACITRRNKNPRMTSSHLKNGASFSCDIYIPASSCQPGFGSSGDTDGDGVDDENDAYPTDPDRSTNTYTPSENSYGTAMFEDLYPHEGDYDFNDVVVNFRTQLVANASNQIVEAKVKLIKMARGGSSESGMAMQLGTVPSAKVESVTGCQLSGFASIGANGVENGQTYANIIFWDKISEAWPNTTGASMQNTVSANPHSAEDTTEVTITFTEPIDASLISGNVYIWVNNDRGREIHFAGKPASDLVDPSYFGTGSDNSDPNDVTTMYKGNGNRPWAMEIYSETSHTEEKVDFTKAYLHFSNWALSSGGSYNDWYRDESGYRGSDSKFYTK